MSMGKNYPSPKDQPGNDQTPSVAVTWVTCGVDQQANNQTW